MPKKICFGVFDWGLGHATRDLPIMEEILRKGHELHIISTGRALRLLRDTLRNRCKYHDVVSMRAPYTKSRFFAINFTVRVPLMLSDLSSARRISASIIEKEKFDIVISDCRYDVYDRHENSFLINHQVRFAAKIGERVMERWLAHRQHRYGRILVPDYEEDGLSGRLGHDLRYVKTPISYVGILSRLKRVDVQKDVELFISISGPEPQRTELENKIMSQRTSLPKHTVITLGKPEDSSKRTSDGITIHGYLDGEQQEMMNRAKRIICRSGYTTMMEFSEIGVKDALLIPTPGQTEQEELSAYYEERRWFHSVPQDELLLERDLCVEGYTGFPDRPPTAHSVQQVMTILDL